MRKFAKILANGTTFARYFCESSSLGNWLSKNLSQNLRFLRQIPAGLGNKSMPIGFLTDAQRRIERSLFMLEWIKDPELRRRVQHSARCSASETVRAKSWPHTCDSSALAYYF